VTLSLWGKSIIALTVSVTCLSLYYAAAYAARWRERRQELRWQAQDRQRTGTVDSMIAVVREQPADDAFLVALEAELAEMERRVRGEDRG
jgi:hypothetical protein